MIQYLVPVKQQLAHIPIYYEYDILGVLVQVQYKYSVCIHTRYTPTV